MASQLRFQAPATLRDAVKRFPPHKQAAAKSAAGKVFTKTINASLDGGYSSPKAMQHAEQAALAELNYLYTKMPKN